MARVIGGLTTSHIPAIGNAVPREKELVDDPYWKPFFAAYPPARAWLQKMKPDVIFTGYAALFLSFGASILYLMQERALKSKSSSGMFSRLPALQVIDDIGYRSLMLGFPFMTLGLLAGSVVAESTYGRVDFFDPKILLSVLMWAVYLLMVYTRLNAGWRGRCAALLR